ncbi:DUF2249 domain-containing protein [Massilia rhizosphaerae]|jgi:uncharacterized protein (DUF2249 family)|uniref:DUF2249 domain-containing protein n=1 Tax=Massilia rhizosphaerae TaxID=2784389 RepID=UPI0018DE45A5|nr:DUF2249 domain-containing protein [Massilia rhizosphaerae]
MNTILDLRDLPAPQPLERILDALDGLADGAELCVLLAREPHPLYGILAHDGYRWRSTWRDDGCLVTIARNA